VDDGCFSEKINVLGELPFPDPLNQDISESSLKLEHQDLMDSYSKGLELYWKKDFQNSLSLFKKINQMCQDSIFN